jgi:hypothetical protein
MRASAAHFIEQFDLDRARWTHLVEAVAVEAAVHFVVDADIRDGIRP